MYSVPMAIIDFIPVFLFGMSGHLLRRNLAAFNNKSAYSLICTGTINVFIAGALKAIYKLLYALNICDFKILQQMLMPLQGIGFLMAGIGFISLIRGAHKKKAALYSAAVPVAFTGTFVFVIMMILGLASINVSLALLAKKLHKPGAIILFVISFILSLAMGGLSSQDLTLGSINWIAESVNTFSQLALLSGIVILDHAGLRNAIAEAQAA